jgi:hypothetical protein
MSKNRENTYYVLNAGIISLKETVQRSLKSMPYSCRQQAQVRMEKKSLLNWQDDTSGWADTCPSLEWRGNW